MNREKGNIAYSVIYTDFARPDPKTDPQAVLKALTEAFAQGTKEKKDIKLNGFPGIELVRELEQDGGKLAMTYRAYFVNSRLYQVMVVSAAGVKEKVQVGKFLDSFKLHENKDGTEPKKNGKQ